MVESDNFLNKLHLPLLTFLKMDNKLVSSRMRSLLFFPLSLLRTIAGMSEGKGRHNTLLPFILSSYPDQ